MLSGVMKLTPLAVTSVMITATGVIITDTSVTGAGDCAVVEISSEGHSPSHTQGSQISPHIKPDWAHIGHIWDFKRTIFDEPKMY